MNRPTKKFDWKNAGPYKIKKIIFSYTYQLKLPNTVKIHPVFHTLVLRPAATALNALPRQIQDPPPPVEVDNKDKYFVKRVNNIKHNKWKC